MMWNAISEITCRRLSHVDESDLEYLGRLLQMNQIVKESSGPVMSMVAQFLKHGRDIGKDTPFERPPCYDHGHFFKSKTGKIFCVYCPYDVSENEKVEIQNWCLERDLVVKIHARSWYSKDSLMIVISIADNFLV